MQSAKTVFSRKTSSLRVITVIKSSHLWTTQSLDSENPTLTNSGNIIDYYGPCDESPVGEDQIQEQKLEAQHRFDHGYEY
jgi:hypothetical protein